MELLQSCAKPQKCTLLVLKQEYSWITRSMTWPLVLWLLAPSHQEHSYRLCRVNGLCPPRGIISFDCATSVLRNYRMYKYVLQSFKKSRKVNACIPINLFVSLRLLQKNYFVNHSRQETSSKEMRGNPHASSHDFSDDHSLYCNGVLRHTGIRQEIKVRKPYT